MRSKRPQNDPKMMRKRCENDPKVTPNDPGSTQKWSNITQNDATSCWPACVRKCGLIPLSWSEPTGVNKAQLEIRRVQLIRFVVFYHSMIASLLLARLREERILPVLFPPRKRPPMGATSDYPFGELTVVLPNSALAFSAAISTLSPQIWGWELSFRDALLIWLRALRWQAAQGCVTFLELALDFEAYTKRTLPSTPNSRLVGQKLPLQERARVLPYL